MSSKSNEVSEQDTSAPFDIQLVYESFEKCCQNSDALDMEHYLVAFRELYRFFTLLGSVFSFVASDVISKVTILEEYRQSELSSEYKTIQLMIEHETAQGKTKDTTKPSGSRTLLRLHRSLEFIMSFMQDFSIAEPNAKSSVIAQKCYKETLAQYHPWLIQKGAYIAMYALPARQSIIEKVSGKTCDENAMNFYVKLMNGISTIAKRVYDETQKLYEANGLLDLP